MQAQDNRIGKSRNIERLLIAEEEIQEQKTKTKHLETTLQTAWDKVDDLENRGRRNNLRLVGIPESIKPIDLNRLCAVTIPKALGMDKPCRMEWAHRIGPLIQTQKNPRQVIVKYLEYGEKADIMQKYKNTRDLQIEGQNLLIFADYSAERTRKRKLFSKVCTQLFNKRLKFTLAYPATLHFQSTDGTQKTRNST